MKQTHPFKTQSAPCVIHRLIDAVRPELRVFAGVLAHKLIIKNRKWVDELIQAIFLVVSQDIVTPYESAILQILKKLAETAVIDKFSKFYQFVSVESRPFLRQKTNNLYITLRTFEQ